MLFGLVPRRKQVLSFRKLPMKVRLRLHATTNWSWGKFAAQITISHCGLPPCMNSPLALTVIGCDYQKQSRIGDEDEDILISEKQMYIMLIIARFTY
jgi:hypothetical protein